jgi:hypothetical protein
MADVEERADVRVVQAGNNAGFVVEPSAAPWIIGNAVRQDFDRRHPIQARIARAR